MEEHFAENDEAGRKLNLPPGVVQWLFFGLAVIGQYVNSKAEASALKTQLDLYMRTTDRVEITQRTVLDRLARLENVEWRVQECERRLAKHEEQK